MDGVSVQGRSSSATYMPIFSSATGTLFFICVRLPHARAASGCGRARGAEGALRVHLSQDPAGGRGDRSAEPAAERLPVAIEPDRADRVLADRDPAHRGRILGAGARLPAQRRLARASAAVDPAGGVRRGGARRRVGVRDGGVLPGRRLSAGIHRLCRGVGDCGRAADVLHRLVDLRPVRGRRDDPLQRRAVRVWHGFFSSARRRGAAPLYRERRYRVSARQGVQQCLWAAQRLRAALGRQCPYPGAARRAARQPARGASRGAGFRPQARPVFRTGADRGVRGGPARHDPRHESGCREPVRLRGAGDVRAKLQLLRAGAIGEVSKEQDEMVEIAEKNSQRLLDLINEVLDIEKIESGQLTLVPEPMPLDALLGESLRLNQGYADRFRANLALHGEVPQVVVRADRKRLMQVMTNLLSNAAKFSPPNSAVDVTVAQKEAVVRVEVSDRGPGIPEAFRGRIFGRFAQADSADSRVKGGTGLGLAICKRLVEMMQGHVGFEDRKGGGTTFFFELPVMPPEETAANAAPRVLLTEHDTVAAEYLSMVLENGGYRVDAAPDASASRELLGRWKYAVWLLARRLRDGEDPLALIAEVKPRLGGTPIIMLASTRSDAAYVSEPQRVGVVDWLLKSDSRTRILDAVAHALGRA